MLKFLNEFAGFSQPTKNHLDGRNKTANIELRSLQVLIIKTAAKIVKIVQICLTTYTLVPFCKTRRTMFPRKGVHRRTPDTITFHQVLLLRPTTPTRLYDQQKSPE